MGKKNIHCHFPIILYINCPGSDAFCFSPKSSLQDKKKRKLASQRIFGKEEGEGSGKPGFLSGRHLGRLGTVSQLVDLFPVDLVPPVHGELVLSALCARAELVIPQPHVLPGVQAQNGQQVGSAGRKVVSAPRGVRCVAGAVGRVLEESSARGEALGRAGADVGVGVNLLAAPVGAGVRRAGEVGGEHLVRVWSAGEVRLDEPDEARTEHGRGGLDHLGFEGLDRAERSDQVALEVFGHGDLARWGDAVEEEVVVVGHAGVVEDGGILGFAGGGENNVLEVLGLKVGFCREHELACASSGEETEGENIPAVKPFSLCRTWVW